MPRTFLAGRAAFGGVVVVGETGTTGKTTTSSLISGETDFVALVGGAEAETETAAAFGVAFLMRWERRISVLWLFGGW